MKKKTQLVDQMREFLKLSHYIYIYISKFYMEALDDLLRNEGSFESKMSRKIEKKPSRQVQARTLR